MITNYLKVAWRNLMKYKFISFINLFGLTVGLTCCLLISTYILNELSYDRYNKNADDIYRITRTFYNQDGAVSLKAIYHCAALWILSADGFSRNKKDDAPACGRPYFFAV